MVSRDIECYQCFPHLKNFYLKILVSDQFLLAMKQRGDETKEEKSYETIANHEKKSEA